ncbi:MAG: cytochrome c [Bryobacteraceae bacterium]
MDTGSGCAGQIFDKFQHAGRICNAIRRNPHEHQRTVAVLAGLRDEERNEGGPGNRRFFAAGLIVCLLLAAVAWRVSTSPRRRLYHPPTDQISIPTDQASVARGKHLAEAVAVCTICHGVNLGGQLAFQDSFLGRGYTSNLTRGRGGVGRSYADADWVRGIRYGVRPDGHGIPFMPSDYFNKITDPDLGALIAYLKSLPPVDNERTRVEINWLPRLLIDLGFFGDLVRAAKIDFRAPRPGPAATEGEYLVTVGGCTFCHGGDLAGGQGPEPGAPAGTNLAAGGPLSRWSFADFRNTMRTGVDPTGHAINPKYMPWLAYRNMTDPELDAIWKYLRSFSPQSDARKTYEH